MQMIKMMFRADSVSAVAVDEYNMPSEAETPSITRGMAVDLMVGLFRDREEDTRMTAAELGQYASWDFCLANDWDTSTPVQIRVREGIEVDADGFVRIRIRNTNTQELLELLGNSETVSLGCELDAYLPGEDVPAMVLQWDMRVRNRRMDDSTATPEPVPPGTYTAAQLQAMLSAALEFQYSRTGAEWHPVQTEHDVYMRSRSTATADAQWSPAIAVPKGADGRTVEPDGIGPLAERPPVAAEGYCYISTEGMAYWYHSGVWTEGVALVNNKGDKGDKLTFADLTAEDREELRGPQGRPFTYEDFTAEQLQRLKVKGDPFTFDDFTPEELKALTGPAGDGLHVDHTDTLSRRHLKDNAAAGFVYMATDLYADSIETGRVSRYQRDALKDPLNNDGAPVAYAWSNQALVPSTLYTAKGFPGIGSEAYTDTGLTEGAQLVTDRGPAFTLFYQKRTSDLADWSEGVRLYVGRQGDKGDKGDPGLKGNDGDAAFAPPDLVFLETADPENPDIPVIDTADAVHIPGCKPVAEVLKQIDDPENPGFVAYVRADEGTDYTLRYCLDEQHTLLYILNRAQWPKGGRVRFAQAGALTPKFLHVAYASNSQGADFSLTPNNLLQYRAEIFTTTQGDPTLEDFQAAGAAWIQYCYGTSVIRYDGQVPIALDTGWYSAATRQVTIGFGAYPVVGLQAPSGVYYAVEKADCRPDAQQNRTVIDLSRYLLYENAAGMATGWIAYVAAGKDGKDMTPDAVGLLSERPAQPADGYMYVATDEAKVYWFLNGAWSAGVAITVIPGPPGQDGKNGTDLTRSTVIPRTLSGTAAQIGPGQCYEWSITGTSNMLSATAEWSQVGEEWSDMYLTMAAGATLAMQAPITLIGELTAGKVNFIQFKGFKGAIRAFVVESY